MENSYFAEMSRATTLGHLIRGDVWGPLDVFSLAEAAGFDVSFVPLYESIQEIIIGRNIAISDRLDELDARWALAHALGHFALQADINVENIRVSGNGILASVIEFWADRFAMGLLIDLDEALTLGFRTKSQIARYFRVPEKEFIVVLPD